MNSAVKQAVSDNKNEINDVIISNIIEGESFQIRKGFNALGFRHASFGTLMDPLIMVDHFTMTKPTFGTHPHAGLSAVSLVFEDSVGQFHNQDSLGNNFDLLPGDLYWLNAGSGIVHDEAPREGAKIHGLQVFVNLPKSLKYSAPQSTLVRSQQIPLIIDESYRVRVVLGESNGVVGKIIPSNYLTILDGKLFGPSRFSHKTNAGEQSWIYAVSGCIDVSIGDEIVTLKQGQAISAKAVKQVISIINKQNVDAHFVLFSGAAIAEKFVQRGPFAMSTEAENNAAQRKYDLGLFGSIGKNFRAC